MNTIKEYSFVEKALTELTAMYKDVPNAETKEGYQACKDGAKAVAKYRIALEEKRVKIKGPALKKCKAIDEEAKRIQLVIAGLENPLKLAYKDVDEKNKKIEEERVSGILAIIDGMTVFIDMAKNGTTETISEWIEQVEDIDCSDKNMFSEFSKDAALERNRVLEALQIELRRTIQQDADEKKRKDQEAELEESRIKQAAADEKLRKAEADQRITDRINALRMQPADYFGKSSTTIDAHIVTLSRFMITEQEFGDRCGEVSTALDLVVSQLEMASESAKRIEYVEKVEADKKANELEDEKENARQVVEPNEEKEVDEPVETATVDDLPIEQTPEETEAEAIGTKICNDDIRGFLEECSTNTNTIEDFGYLLISQDPMENAQALDNIRTRFSDYVTS